MRVFFLGYERHRLTLLYCDLSTMGGDVVVWHCIASLCDATLDLSRRPLLMTAKPLRPTMGLVYSSNITPSRLSVRLLTHPHLNYSLSQTAILYFDYLLTLTTEIRRIWTARFSGATLLFLLNRYVPLVGYIPVMVSLFDPPWSIEVSVYV